MQRTNRPVKMIWGGEAALFAYLPRTHFVLHARGTSWEPYESYVHLPAEFSSPISRNKFGYSVMSQSAGGKFVVGTRRIMHPLLDKSSCNSSCANSSAWGYRTGSVHAGRLVNTYAKVLVAKNVA